MIISFWENNNLQILSRVTFEPFLLLKSLIIAGPSDTQKKQAPQIIRGLKVAKSQRC